MKTTIQWFIPCYFNTENGHDDEIILDITDSVKNIFSNDVAGKKIEYGFNHGLKNVTQNQISKVKIKILPRFMSGFVNENRIVEFIEENSSKIYSHFNTDNYKKWNHNLGVVCIQVTMNYNTNSIPTRNEIKDFRFNQIFLTEYHKNKAILQEISSFFLSALHLTFPTRSIMMWNDNPINDGIMHLNSVKKNYFTSMNTDNFMHHVLIVEQQLDNLKTNIQGLSKVWHLNLWSLKRYLIAVKSNLVDMDNLLDLIYSLEGLFEKNTSSDFIKLFCSASLCKKHNDAKKMKSKLDLVFKLRNEMAHGGLHYQGYEKIKLDGKEILSQELYWDMKTIVSQMLILSISKLLKNTEMRNLNFKTDDFFDILYKET
ncbi:hypothetical protein [Flavobacterium sp. XS2P39]|uniref:hypothetical protein n=1 Tax=Flavobacterium sp. XS2P39 TaxID=3401725 RepID=UPI003AAA930C